MMSSGLVMLAIGDGHARDLLTRLPHARLAYWPRVWAARALSYIGDDEAVLPLLGALHDRHWRVRMTAARTIGVIGDRDAAEHLGPLLEDEHWRVRSAAVLALGRIGGPEQAEALQRAFFDGDERVQDAAGRALASLERRPSRQRGGRGGRVETGGLSAVLEPRPVHIHTMAEPRASRIHVPALPHLTTELWMGGAHSASGHRLHPEDFAGAWVIDCAGDMPSHFREPAAWWLTCIFQDYEEQPASWQRLATLARTIGQTVAGELIEHAIEHPTEPPSRIYVFCNQGLNRSGLVMGRILRALGLAGDEAVRTIVAHRPGAINNLTFARLVRED